MLPTSVLKKVALLGIEGKVFLRDVSKRLPTRGAIFPEDFNIVKRTIVPRVPFLQWAIVPKNVLKGICLLRISALLLRQSNVCWGR